MQFNVSKTEIALKMEKVYIYLNTFVNVYYQYLFLKIKEHAVRSSNRIEP